MTDEQLRVIYERILAAPRATGADDGAPTPEEMLALAEGRGSEAERLRVLDGVMRSEDARRDFELLRAAVAAARPRVWRLAPVFAAAAVVIVAAGLGALWWPDRAADPVRGDTAAVRLTAPNDAPSVSSPLILAWHRVPDAASYEVELVEASGNLVQMATLADTTWTPPPSIHLQAGVEYRWWVRAMLADGRTLESPPRRLVLSP